MIDKVMKILRREYALEDDEEAIRKGRRFRAELYRFDTSTPRPKNQYGDFAQVTMAQTFADEASARRWCIVQLRSKAAHGASVVKMEDVVLYSRLTKEGEPFFREVKNKDNNRL